MFGRGLLVLLLAVSFVGIPEKQAEAGPILRAAARVAGAVVGVAAGAVVLAGRAVARVGIAAANTVRFLFGRPLWWGRRWNQYCNYGCSYAQASYSNSHGNGYAAQERPVANANNLESWCWEKFGPRQEAASNSPAICSVNWRGMKMWGQGNSADTAYARTQVEMCKVGMDADVIQQVAGSIRCESVGGQEF